MMEEIIARILVTLMGLMAIAFLGIVATHSLWLPWLLNNLAEHNLFITSIKEGQAKAFMKFGEFDRLALSWKGHYLDKDWNVKEIPEGQTEPPDDIHPKANHWMDRHLPGGLRWLGVPYANAIHSYSFQWSNMRQGTKEASASHATARGTEAVVYQGDLRDLMITRNEKPDYIILQEDIYGETFQDVEDQEMIPLAFIALLTAQVRNPYDALFRTEQWLEQILNFLRSYIKDYVGQRTFSELTGTVKESDDPTKKNSLSKTQSEIILLEYKSPDNDGTSLQDYILKKWGVYIHHLNFVNFKPGGIRGEAYEKSAATEYVAKQDAKGRIAGAEAESKATIIMAKANAEAQVILAKAEAEALTIQANALRDGGESATTERVLEPYRSMGKNGATIILGAGEKPVQMLINSTKK